MELKAEDYKLSEVLTVSKFVELLRKRTQNMAISNSTIHYHLENTDKLDYVIHSGVKYIVQNDKAATFNPGTYYGKTSKKMNL